MKNIPKNAFFYWGGSGLPFLRYMCMRSFKSLNPGWKAILFMPVKTATNQTWGTFENKVQYTGPDYLPKLLEDNDIYVVKFDMESLGFSNDLPEVIKSDLLRLHLLSSLGGWWFDNDQIAIRPMAHTFPDHCNPDAVAYFCWRRGGPTQEDTQKNGPKYHSIGALAGAPGNPYFTQLFDGAKAVMNTNEYQAVGSLYYKTLINDSNITTPSIVNMAIETFYPSRAVPDMIKRPASQYVNQIREYSIFWHYYCGHPEVGKFQNLINHENYKQFDNIVCYLIDKVKREQGI